MGRVRKLHKIGIIFKLLIGVATRRRATRFFVVPLFLMVFGSQGYYPREGRRRPIRCPAPIYTQGVFEKMASNPRLRKLKALERQLRAALKECESKELAALAKQYRETIREIEEIEGVTDDGDEIAEILAGRQADGKPGAVRKNRSSV